MRQGGCCSVGAENRLHARPWLRTRSPSNQDIELEQISLVWTQGWTDQHRGHPARRVISPSVLPSSRLQLNVSLSLPKPGTLSHTVGHFAHFKWEAFSLCKASQSVKQRVKLGSIQQFCVNYMLLTLASSIQWGQSLTGPASNSFLLLFLTLISDIYCEMDSTAFHAGQALSLVMNMTDN